MRSSSILSLCGAALCVSSILLFSGCEDSNPAGAGTALTPHVLFTSDRDGNAEIFTMDADGTGQQQLTSTSSDVGNYDAASSPDYSRIVFCSDRYGTTESMYSLFLMDGEGAGVMQLTSGFLDEFPRWSPDGRKVVFTRFNTEYSVDIYVVGADGRNQQQLTAASGTSRNYLAVWSPEDNKIAFVSDRDGNSEIYVMDGNGANQRQLTATSGTTLDSSSIYSSNPWFTPDGRQLVFASNRDGDAEIFIMNLDGSGIKQLTMNLADDADPQFAPGCDKIFFVSDRDGDDEIFSMKTDGTNQQQLTSNANDDWF